VGDAFLVNNPPPASIVIEQTNIDVEFFGHEYRLPAAGRHVPASLTARDGPADSSIMAHRGNRATGFYPFQVRSQTVSNFAKKIGAAANSQHA
jgi:hypothetical protein